MWYGILAFGCAALAGAGLWKYKRDIGKLRNLVEEQNKLLKENISELRDEYARVFLEVKKDKKKGGKE